MAPEVAAQRSSRAPLAEAIRRLEAAGISGGRLDAEVLIAAAGGFTRAALLASTLPLTAEVSARFEQMVTRRAAREPLAYITGRKEFYSLELDVTSAVLIPRPETELLAATALDWLSSRSHAQVLELGTGSGAVALALAANNPDLELTASDSSSAALEVARCNAVRLGLAERIAFRHADWLRVEEGGAAFGPFDLILSNPPYIASGEIDVLAPEVAHWEPRAALDGGADGLRAYQEIIRLAPAHLSPGGALMLEIGLGQAPAVGTMLRAAGFNQIDALRDLAGIERVVRAFN